MLLGGRGDGDAGLREGGRRGLVKGHIKKAVGKGCQGTQGALCKLLVGSRLLGIVLDEVCRLGVLELGELGLQLGHRPEVRLLSGSCVAQGL